MFPGKTSEIQAKPSKEKNSLFCFGGKISFLQPQLLKWLVGMHNTVHSMILWMDEFLNTSFHSL